MIIKLPYNIDQRGGGLKVDYFVQLAAFLQNLRSLEMKRKQLTLFLEGSASSAIEYIRKKYNPKQHALIRSHITLCREDEIEDLGVIKSNLLNSEVESFDLKIGELKRFADNKGLLLAVMDQEGNFQNLRRVVLGKENSKLKQYQPHITLMHPRNSICTDDKFREILEMKIPRKLYISKITLIEQEIGLKWDVIDDFSLRSRSKI